MAALTAKIGEVSDRAAQQISTYTNTSVDKTAGTLASDLGNVLGNTAMLVGEANELNAFNEAKALQEEAVIDSVSDPDFGKDIRARYQKDGRVIPANTSKAQLLRLRQISDQRLLRQNNPSQRASKVISAVYGNTADELAKANERAEIKAAANLETQYQNTITQITPVVDDKGNVDKEATIEKGAVFERLGLITSNLNSKGSTSSTRRGIIRSEMLPEIQKAMQHVDKFIHLEVEKGFNALRKVDPLNKEAYLLAYKNFSNTITGMEARLEAQFPTLSDAERELLLRGVKEDADEWMKILKIDDLSTTGALAKISKNITNFEAATMASFRLNLFNNQDIRKMMAYREVLGSEGFARFLITKNASLTDIDALMSRMARLNSPAGTSGYAFSNAEEEVTKDPSTLSTNTNTNNPIHAGAANTIIQAVSVHTDADEPNSPNYSLPNQEKKNDMIANASINILDNDVVTKNWDNHKGIVKKLNSAKVQERFNEYQKRKPAMASILKEKLQKNTIIAVTKAMKDLSDIEVNDNNRISITSDNGILKVVEKPQSTGYTPSLEEETDTLNYRQAMSLGIEAATAGKSTIQLTSSGRKALKLTEDINSLVDGAINFSSATGGKESPSTIRRSLGAKTYSQIYQTTLESKTDPRPLVGTFTNDEGPISWEDNGPWVQIGEVNWNALYTPMESFKLRIPGRDSSTVEEATPPLSNATVADATPPVTEPDNASVEIDPEEVASLWGVAYQGEDDKNKKANFVKQVRKNRDIMPKDVVETITSVVAEVFTGDEKTNVNILTEHMIQIAVAESLGGTEKVQREGGPARGIHQVEPKTAQSLIDNSSLINKPNSKAQVVLKRNGLDITKGYTFEDLEKALLNDEVSTVFATAKLLSGSKNAGQLDRLR